MLLLCLLTACGLDDPAPLATLPYALSVDTPPLALVVANRLVVLSPTDARVARLDLTALTWDEAPLPGGLPLDLRLEVVGDRLTLWGARLDTLGIWNTDDGGLTWRELTTEAAADGRASLMLPLSDGRLLWVVERLDVEEADLTTTTLAAQARVAAAPGDAWSDVPGAGRLGTISVALPAPGGQALLLGGETGMPEEGVVSWASRFDGAQLVPGPVLPERQAWARSVVLVGGEVALLEPMFADPGDAIGLLVRVDSAVMLDAPGEPLEGRFAATPLADGRLLLTGGVLNGAPTAETWLLDPKTAAWTPGPPMSRPRAGHVAAQAPDGRALLVGGVGVDWLGREVALAEVDVLAL
ncbi:kelch repeat-containing protein [Myxococcota bacterium]|nr:kelch repeat-containing protein [Myxococcota bacterium]